MNKTGVYSTKSGFFNEVQVSELGPNNPVTVDSEYERQYRDGRLQVKLEKVPVDQRPTANLDYQIIAKHKDCCYAIEFTTNGTGWTYFRVMDSRKVAIAHFFVLDQDLGQDFLPMAVKAFADRLSHTEPNLTSQYEYVFDPRGERNIFHSFYHNWTSFVSSRSITELVLYVSIIVVILILLQMFCFLI